MSDREKYHKAVIQQQREHDLATGTPVPYRITQALDSRGLDGPEVDEACGVEEPAVDQWETGELIPTPGQIELLAKLTEYPVSYFYWPVTEQGGPGFMCGEDGCEPMWFGPPAPLAEVIAWPGRTVEPELTEPFQDALW